MAKQRSRSGAGGCPGSTHRAVRVSEGSSERIERIATCFLERERHLLRAERGIAEGRHRGDVGYLVTLYGPILGAQLRLRTRLGASCGLPDCCDPQTLDIVELVTMLERSRVEPVDADVLGRLRLLTKDASDWTSDSLRNLAERSSSFGPRQTNGSRAASYYWLRMASSPMPKSRAGTHWHRPRIDCTPTTTSRRKMTGRPSPSFVSAGNAWRRQRRSLHNGC